MIETFSQALDEESSDTFTGLWNNYKKKVEEL
jgi:hypothetical protein